MVTLSFDSMGGDFGPHLAFEASCRYLQRYPGDRLFLVGEKAAIEALWQERHSNATALASRLEMVGAADVVGSNDKPAFALRNRQSSSMWMSLDLLAQGKANACVSGGNTGALMAMGRYLLKPLSGINRPAICKPIPTLTGCGYLLDLGANIDCSSEQLVQFAKMGVAMAKINGVRNPKVGLLNIGVEASKGGQLIQAAATMLKAQNQIDYVGFVEGDGLFGGQVDVLVCDGFIGNVAVKVSEGLVKYIASSFRDTINANLLNRLMGFIIYPLLKPWVNRLNPSLHNGAVMLGLQKVLIKSHGSADVTGMLNALETARELVLGDLPTKIEQQLRQF